MIDPSGGARGRLKKGKSRAGGRKRGRSPEGRGAEVRLTPIEEARVRRYFRVMKSPEEKKLISLFGKPLEEPLLIAFEPEHAAEGLYTALTSGVTYGVSGSVTLVTSTAQIDALHKKGIKFLELAAPDSPD